MKVSGVGNIGASNPEEPQVYRRDEVAEAEPAVPGWTMLVDNLFV